MDAEGVFWQEEYDGAGKPVSDLSVQLFNPAHNKDKFENTALTLTGRIAALQLVYTGAYLDRSIDQVMDYTNYSRGTYASRQRSRVYTQVLDANSRTYPTRSGTGASNSSSGG